MFTEQELQNLIAIVSTHPTPEGVGSQQGQIKIQLINKLSLILKNIQNPPIPSIKETKEVKKEEIKI